MNSIHKNRWKKTNQNSRRMTHARADGPIFGACSVYTAQRMGAREQENKRKSAGLTRLRWSLAKVASDFVIQWHSNH